MKGDLSHLLRTSIVSPTRHGSSIAPTRAYQNRPKHGRQDICFSNRPMEPAINRPFVNRPIKQSDIRRAMYDQRSLEGFLSDPMSVLLGAQMFWLLSDAMSVLLRRTFCLSLTVNQQYTPSSPSSSVPNSLCPLFKNSSS